MSYSSGGLRPAGPPCTVASGGPGPRSAPEAPKQEPAVGLPPAMAALAKFFTP